MNGVRAGVGWEECGRNIITKVMKAVDNYVVNYYIGNSCRS